MQQYTIVFCEAYSEWQVYWDDQMLQAFDSYSEAEAAIANWQDDEAT